MANKREAEGPCDLGQRTNGEGFTLLEVLIVITIMLIIVAIALPRITPMLQAAHKTTIVAKMQMLTKELSAYRMNCGSYPESLMALKASPAKGCSIRSAVVSDPALESGFRFDYTATSPDESGRYEGYMLAAVPSGSGGAGNESYSTDQTGIIRVRRGAPATVSESHSRPVTARSGSPWRTTPVLRARNLGSVPSHSALATRHWPLLT